MTEIDAVRAEEIKTKAESLLGKFDDIGDAMDMFGEDGKKPEAIAAFRQLSALVIEIADWLETLTDDEWKVLLSR